MRQILTVVLGLLFGVWISLFWTKPALAAEQFQTDYQINYVVNDQGVTSVDEKITLKNLTDKYFASNFVLTIDSAKVTDVSASDSQGPLETKVSTENGKSQVEVKFIQQVVGKDKEYNWTLKYKSGDFAFHYGKIWQISIPKTTQLGQNDELKVALSVPVSFGDPESIVPSPVGHKESAGQIIFNYSKDELAGKGILANFGDTQQFNFGIKYQLENSSILPIIAKVPIPADSAFQKVLILNIDPTPEQVSVDSDGNYLAWFKVPQRQNLEVYVSGFAKLQIKPDESNLSRLSPAQLKTYTSGQKYWEVSNPVIKARLDEIFKDYSKAKIADLPNSQKIELINRFVTTHLNFSYDRMIRGDYERLGALTTLSNPDAALSSEFTDLFVALARSMGVPARRVEGYAYSLNKSLRPLSLSANSLHVWPEYYDSRGLWVMIDPTWENTSGADYLTNFDLNHLVVSRLGVSSIEPNLNAQVISEFSDEQPQMNMQFKLGLDAQSEVLAGFPIRIQGEVSNNGNVAIPASQLVLKSTVDGVLKDDLIQNSEIIPPFGRLKFIFHLKPSEILKSQTKTVVVSFNGQNVSTNLELRPFYNYSLFLILAIVAVLVFVGLYVLSLLIHIRGKGVFAKIKLPKFGHRLKKNAT